MYLDMGFETLDLTFCELKLREPTVVDYSTAPRDPHSEDGGVACHGVMRDASREHDFAWKRFPATIGVSRFTNLGSFYVGGLTIVACTRRQGKPHGPSVT